MTDRPHWAQIAKITPDPRHRGQLKIEIGFQYGEEFAVHDTLWTSRPPMVVINAHYPGIKVRDNRGRRNAA